MAKEFDSRSTATDASAPRAKSAESLEMLLGKKPLEGAEKPGVEEAAASQASIADPETPATEPAKPDGFEVASANTVASGALSTAAAPAETTSGASSSSSSFGLWTILGGIGAAAGAGLALGGGGGGSNHAQADSGLETNGSGSTSGIVPTPTAPVVVPTIPVVELPPVPAIELPSIPAEIPPAITTPPVAEAPPVTETPPVAESTPPSNGGSSSASSSDSGSSSGSSGSSSSGSSSSSSGASSSGGGSSQSESQSGSSSSSHSSNVSHVAKIAAPTVLVEPVVINGSTFTLSDNVDPDNINGTAKNDLFSASVGDLNNQDQLNGAGGNDVLRVVMGGGENQLPQLIDIENIDVISLGATPNYLNLGNELGGLKIVNVIDSGDDSAPLNITGLDNDTVRVNLLRDGVEANDIDVSLAVENSAGEDAVDVGVDGYEGNLTLANAIEIFHITTAGVASDMELTDDGKALKSVYVTGNANLRLVSHSSTLYDFTASTAAHNELVLDNPAKLAATVLFGTGDDLVDFQKNLETKGDPADIVNGGAGFDTLKADVDKFDVEPTVTKTEVISLAFVGTGLFDATGVTNSPDGTVYEIRKSTGYVNINDISNGANINIVEDVDNGGKGSTFDFAGKDATTTITFVTDSSELTAIKHTGDLEVNDVRNLSVDVDGAGEVEIFGAIALDNAATKFLSISTNSEDDDDADNDGDLTVHGDVTGTGISQSAALENLTIKAVNGNIFLADGLGAPGAPGTSALKDASALKNLDLLADNATLSLGDIGDGEAALNLAEEGDNAVNILGINTGVFNLDDIYAGELIHDDEDLETGAIFEYTAKDGAFIEEFNVTTAKGSETKASVFDEESTPFGYNQIDDIVARVIEDFEINVAEDGRLQIGDVYASLDNVTITGAGRLDLYNNNNDGETGYIAVNADEETEAPDGDDGVLFYGNRTLTMQYVNEINAKNHTGPIELDFRTFTGADNGFSQKGGFDNADYVDATINLGNQNTIDNGIRFDSYGLDPDSFYSGGGGQLLPGLASVTVNAGNGNHLYVGDDSDNFEGSSNGGQTDLDGAPLYGLDIGTDYGIVTGFGNDSITTGTGKSNIFAGAGDDTIHAGSGADVVRGGYGQDLIDLGKGDGAADAVQLVGGYLESDGGDISNFDTAESLGVDYDRIVNFEAGTGKDVAELWNFGLDTAGGAANPFVGPVAVHREVVGDQSSFIDLFPDYVDMGQSSIIEFIGISLNFDLKSEFNNELIELDFQQQFLGDVKLADYTGTQDFAGFFAIAYDAEGDDAALFLVDSITPTDFDDIQDISPDDVQLVAVFEGVKTDQFTTGDFVFGQVLTPSV